MRMVQDMLATLERDGRFTRLVEYVFNQLIKKDGVAACMRDALLARSLARRPA